MTENQFVSTINLTDKRRQPIPAGIIFVKSDMVKGTFESLQEAGDIVLYTPGDATDVLRAAAGRSLGGPANQTPAAAIHPRRKGPEVLDNAELAEKAEITETLRGMGVRVQHNCKLSTLKAKLARAIEDGKTPPATGDEGKVEKKKGPAKVWDMSPEEANTMPLAQLYAKYIEKCKEFGLTPDNNPTEESVRAKMSSEYAL